MIQIPNNEKLVSDYEAVVNDVLNQLASGKDKYGEGALGTAYIDWGVISEFYQNCPTRFIADKVAYEFKAKGYYVYVQRMGSHHVFQKVLPSATEYINKPGSITTGKSFRAFPSVALCRSSVHRTAELPYNR